MYPYALVLLERGQIASGVGIKTIMEKKTILDHIRLIAHANGGKAPGVRVFERETGIANQDWFPHLWLRWSEALIEAGYSANEFQSAHNREFVIEKYIELIRELGRVPVKGELLRKAKANKAFPNEKVFYRDGKEGLVAQVIQYCQDHPGHEDVMAVCTEYRKASSATVDPQVEMKSKITIGFVYLMRSGRHHKIGRSVSVGSRERQLAIKIPVPPTTIHSIATDDPVGVEAYWHKRFADKRGEGEWFDLSTADIQAFKRWKRII